MSDRVRTLVRSFASGEEEGCSAWSSGRRSGSLRGLRVSRSPEISRRTGLHRKTIRTALAAAEPPKYSRLAAGSVLDPFRNWICDQHAIDPRIQSQRLGERPASWAMRAASPCLMTMSGSFGRGS